MRIEKDSLGEVEVPEAAYYGVHTCRSLANFGEPDQRLPVELLRALAELKRACARANTELGLLDAQKAGAIEQACAEMLAGRFDDQFPLGMLQAGSGTSTNMNVNEVLANRACELLGGRRGERGRVHPNDDVNRGQSTNNMFPSAIRVAAVHLASSLRAAMERLIHALRDRAAVFKDVIKSGRTHLQDAVPVTLGQEFSAWARALEKDLGRLDLVLGAVREIGAGGNAAGTGVNTPRAFRPAIVRHLNEQTGDLFRAAEDGVEITQFLTDLGELSSVLRLTALDLQKICNDLRLLASGPNTGLGELRLPAVEPGSSIMPGKINPSICEAVNMACMQVQGYDHAIALACGAGQLELNTHMPLVAANLLGAIKLLAHAAGMLAVKCVAGLDANREVCASHFARSAGLPTILNPVLGYDRVAELVKEALRTGRTLRDLVLEQGILDEAAFDDLLRRSTGPHP